MADTSSILAGFKTVLEAAISGLRVYAGDPDAFAPPGVVVIPRGRRAGSLNRAVQMLTFDLTVAVKPGTLRTAQASLYDYLDDTGSSSIEAALLASPTLNGSVSDIIDITISDGQAWGRVSYGGKDYPAGVMRVEVITG